jgi:hypothetical protein
VTQIRLEFRPSEASAGGSSFPVAYVSFTTRGTAGAPETVHLSPPCVSVQELEAAVRSLHRQLDGVLAEGRQLFARG